MSTKVATLRDYTETVSGLVWGKDGRVLVSIHDSGTIALWSAIEHADRYLSYSSSKVGVSASSKSPMTFYGRLISHS